MWEQFVTEYDVTDATSDTFKQNKEMNAMVDDHYRQMKKFRKQWGKGLINRGKQSLGRSRYGRTRGSDFDYVGEQMVDVSDDELRSAAIALAFQRSNGGTPLILGGTHGMQRLMGLAQMQTMSDDQQNELLKRNLPNRPPNTPVLASDMITSAVNSAMEAAPIETVDTPEMLEHMLEDQVLTQDEHKIAQRMYWDKNLLEDYDDYEERVRLFGDDELPNEDPDYEPSDIIDVTDEIEQGQLKGGKRGARKFDNKQLQEQLHHMEDIENQRDQQREQRLKSKRIGWRERGIGSQRDELPPDVDKRDYNAVQDHKQERKRLEKQQHLADIDVGVEMKHKVREMEKKKKGKEKDEEKPGWKRAEPSKKDLDFDDI